jgi:protein-S-isoprenylcysteine O-methyltransferase Ste14
MSTTPDIVARMGRKPLNRTWAKAEILLGLLAAVAGLLAAVRAVTRSDIDWSAAVPAAVLAVLGLYLAMAGHRSHLYQSQNETAAWLASLIERPGTNHGGTDKDDNPKRGSP